MASDATYQAKNYEKQGASEWVVGGLLTIAAGGVVVPDGQTAPPVLTALAGGDTNIADAVASINAIIAALKGVGISG